MKLIVGLGNPGAKYENTRHNAGFKVIDSLAERFGIVIKNKEHKGLTGKGVIMGEKVILLKPQTFMNNSGDSLAPLAAYYGIHEDDIIVVYDDIYLEPGHIRIRKKGSAGGHNGMKSIIARLGSENFVRVRVGVGAKPEQYDLADWVLGHFDKNTQADAERGVEDAARAVSVILSEGADTAMNLFNGN
ncbi:MAG: aminoacyl-tRNA hydrolase [Lachnospiraceae bacterium]